MQSLYYKGSSKHVLKSVSKELGTGIEREKGYRPITKEHYNINKE